MESNGANAVADMTQRALSDLMHAIVMMINVITVTEQAIMRATVEVIVENVAQGHALPVIRKTVAVILVQEVDLLEVKDVVVTVVVVLLEVKDAVVTVVIVAAVVIVMHVAVVVTTHVTVNAIISIRSVHQQLVGIAKIEDR